MEKMKVPAVGRMTAADFMQLKVRTLVYLDELERSLHREIRYIANAGSIANFERARQNYDSEIASTKLLLEKLDETVQAILMGELEVSPEAVAQLPRKANR